MGLQEQIDSIDVSHLHALSQKLDDLKAEKLPHDTLIDVLPNEIGALVEKIRQSKGLLAQNQENQSDTSNAQRELETDLFFDYQLIYEQQQKHVNADSNVVWDSHQKSYEESISKTQGVKSDFEELIKQAEARGEYYAKLWHFKLVKSRDLKELKELIDAEIDTLHSTGLIRHQEKAGRARESIVQMFRQDIIANLQDRFQEMDDQIQLLNFSLQNRVLHNQRYQLKAKPESAYENLVKYIKTASKEELDSVDSLFDSIPEDVLEIIKSIVESGIGEDYRHYFNYEFILTDVKTHETSKLSGTLGTGSGGEKQTPLYIAIAAALSSAWRSDRGTDGAALALFDEAFKDLDSYNLQTAITFMQDVGLQMIYAAPDDKELNFRESGINTIVYLTKDVDVIDVDIDVPNEKGLLLPKQNPNANKELMNKLVELEMVLENAAGE